MTLGDALDCAASRVSSRRCVAAIAMLLAAWPSLALAADPASQQPVWRQWDFSADLVIPSALALILYWRGLEKRPGAFDETPLRHLAFLGGVFLTFASLASPIDAMADHLFSMHQVQHLLLRMVGPMLIAFAQPQATLITGSPAWLRRGVITAVLTSGPSRGLFSVLTRPWIATALFVASLYVWQWPPFHDRALLDDGVHYVMHITMLAAGLLYFWRVFDRRPPPKGASFGVRLMMLWIGVLVNIPIGAFTSFKTQELYPAYDTVGRLFGLSPMSDERLGGFIMWVPASMMMLAAVLVVTHAWGAREEQLADRFVQADERQSAVLSRDSRPAGPSPRKNSAFALGLAGFSFVILAATLTIALFVVRAEHARALDRSGADFALTSHAPVHASLSVDHD